MASKDFRIRDRKPGLGATLLSADDIKSAAAPQEMSQPAKEHLQRVEKISADLLRDLDAVSDDIGRLRDEITLRTRMLGEATTEFDELARTASQGYVSIRNAIDMVRQKFASVLRPSPSFPPSDAPEQQGQASRMPDTPQAAV